MAIVLKTECERNNHTDDEVREKSYMDYYYPSSKCCIATILAIGIAK
jgi:hypothetical protein